MNIWKRVFGGWRRSPSANDRDSTTTDDASADHLDLARESLRELLGDRRLPAGVREALSEDYRQVQAMLEKLEHGHVHIAALGRVSTGKSSLLNALIGENLFAVSPLHGETRTTSMHALREEEVGGVYVIDTPGIDEAGGEEREELAREVAGRADLVMFVVDGDMTATEFDALQTVVRMGRPVVLVLNKADRYDDDERQALLRALRERVDGVIDPRNVIPAAADPAPRTVITREPDGEEHETLRRPPADVEALRLRLWEILQREGKTLAALNASIFAADLTDKVGQRILEARREVAERVVRTYCIAKGAAVALNPVPVADLFAAAFIDIGMVVHLSRIYDLPIARREAGTLVRVIMTEAAALMGTVWAVHFVSSALKVGTGGLSTLVTAGAQGAIAYYSTYVVGRVADQYLAQGKSWGDGGPKRVVSEILSSLDRDTILREAREEIRQRLRAAQ
ncbi:MAG: GTP-binding protein [Gammaproteobacteria bacterium]